MEVLDGDRAEVPLPGGRVLLPVAGAQPGHRALLLHHGAVVWFRQRLKT